MTSRQLTPNSARGHRKPFKSPFRTPITSNSPVPTNSVEADNNTEKLSKISNNSQSDINLTNNSATPQRKSSGIKRSTILQGGNFRKSFRAPFRSPVAQAQNSSTEKNGDDNKINNIESILVEMKSKESMLDLEIKELESDGCKVEDLQLYIHQLHQYNEIKDSAQLVMGRIADMEQVSLKEIHKRFNADHLN